KVSLLQFRDPLRPTRNRDASAAVSVARPVSLCALHRQARDVSRWACRDRTSIPGLRDRRRAQLRRGSLHNLCPNCKQALCRLPRSAGAPDSLADAAWKLFARRGPQAFLHLEVLRVARIHEIQGETAARKVCNYLIRRSL